mmetsp:Transcript_54922/g.128415  ORF Transcript_54922/g.128415 Transcript_54922/m.128415 type:complete len:263 (-) Transcript_54922:116-904(-)
MPAPGPISNPRLIPSSPISSACASVHVELFEPIVLVSAHGTTKIGGLLPHHLPFVLRESTKSRMLLIIAPSPQCGYQTTCVAGVLRAHVLITIRLWEPRWEPMEVVPLPVCIKDLVVEVASSLLVMLQGRVDRPMIITSEGTWGNVVVPFVWIGTTSCLVGSQMTLPNKIPSRRGHLRSFTALELLDPRDVELGVDSFLPRPHMDDVLPNEEVVHLTPDLDVHWITCVVAEHVGTLARIVIHPCLCVRTHDPLVGVGRPNLL